MNDTSPRCAGPGTACRLLQLETPGARPVWAVLDAAGLRRFTGEITLASRPVVRAYFNDGEVYYAERDGDPTIGQRLVDYGVVTVDELVAGTVQLGKVGHLGRLFDRVPTLDRDAVELVLELITGEVLGEIADHTVDDISIASYRHHPTGVVKWRRRASSATTGADDLLTGEVPIVQTPSTPAASTPATPTPATLAQGDSFFAPPAPPVGLRLATPVVDHTDTEPTAEDHAMVAEYEQMMAAAALEPPPIDVTELDVTEPDAVFEPDVIEPDAVFEVDAEPIAFVELPSQTDAEPAHEDTEPAPFSFGFDLNEVLAQVVRENDGIPISNDDIADDVRAAVREALAEIEAATRPTPGSDLSATAFAIALETAPDTAADIEPAGAAMPYLPVRDLPVKGLGTPTGSQPTVTDETPAVDPVPSSDAPSTGLRRLIGGSRKP